MRTPRHMNSFLEMEVIGNRLFDVAVPVNSDSEFKAYILAAGSAYALGNRSIDNVLRKHCDEWIRRFEQDRESPFVRGQELRVAIAVLASARSAELSRLDLSSASCAGAFAAANAQIRLESTILAALHLIWLGFAFESEAVIRLGLEQVSWTYGVREIQDQDTVDGTSGTGWITSLKELFPGAGRIYSRLSNLAHVAPSTHERFVRTSAEGTSISLKSPSAVKESCLLLIILLDAYLVVSEKCNERFGLQQTSMCQTSGAIIENRPATKLITEFADCLPSSGRAIFSAWWGEKV